MILYIILFSVFCIFLLNIILLSITKSNKDIIEYLQKVYPLMDLNNVNSTSNFIIICLFFIIHVQNIGKMIYQELIQILTKKIPPIIIKLYAEQLGILLIFVITFLPHPLPSVIFYHFIIIINIILLRYTQMGEIYSKIGQVIDRLFTGVSLLMEEKFLVIVEVGLVLIGLNLILLLEICIIPMVFTLKMVNGL